MAERVQRRLVPLRVSEIRKERVDVFRLVVRPNRGVIRLAARAVHQAARRSVNALRSADFRERERGVQDRLRRFDDELAPNLRNERDAGGFLGGEVDRRFALALPFRKRLNREVYGRAFPRFQRRVAGIRDRRDGRIRPVDAAFRVGLVNVAQFRNAQSDRFRSDVFDRRAFANEGPGRRREEAALDFDRLSVGVEAANDRQNPVQRDAERFFVRERFSVERYFRRQIVIEANRQTRVRVVRNRSQHRPNDRAVQAERALFVDAVSKDGRDALAARFKMVVVRNAGRRKIGPSDSAVRFERPTRRRRFLRSSAAERRDASERRPKRRRRPKSFHRSSFRYR